MAIIQNWTKVLIKPTHNLGKGIKVIQKSGLRIALVVGKDNKLQGTLTDGDIRRALISGMTMSVDISDVMNKNPVTAKRTDSKEHILSLMSDMSILHVPILDDDNTIYGLETLHRLTEKPSHDNPVFLLAGGLGKRLRPLTENTPKPLLKVGNKPILETIVNQFIENGFKNFYISTYFKPESIKDYFKDGAQQGINIKYIHEDKPLGTAGSLGLIPKTLPDLPIIIMNADLLTEIDFNHLLDYHNSNKANATMCVKEYFFQVPYGVVEIDRFKIKGITEKPVHKFFVNAGIYILNKNLVDKIDGKTYLDMPVFLEKELGNGGVNAFPIHEYWLDIGHMKEYKKANQDINTLFNK